MGRLAPQNIIQNTNTLLSLSIISTTHFEQLKVHYKFVALFIVLHKKHLNISELSVVFLQKLKAKDLTAFLL